MSRVARDPEHALAILRGGGVIAYPTEAVYGLGCRADDEAAVARIRRLKARPAIEGMIILIDSLDSLADWIDPLEPGQGSLLAASWPGPETWLLPASERAPVWLTGRGHRLAARLPDHPLCRRLLRGLGTALVSTSANRREQPPARTAAEADRIFGDDIDLVLEGPLGDLESPTRIRDLESGEVIRA